jgi:hypothetical protein
LEPQEKAQAAYMIVFFEPLYLKKRMRKKLENFLKKKNKKKKKNFKNFFCRTSTRNQED